jgi:hypothetical protein
MMNTTKPGEKKRLIPLGKVTMGTITTLQNREKLETEKKESEQ